VYTRYPATETKAHKINDDLRHRLSHTNPVGTSRAKTENANIDCNKKISHKDNQRLWKNNTTIGIKSIKPLKKEKILSARRFLCM